MACRVAADQARRDVERQENAQTAIFEKMGAEYVKLAERFKRAREAKLALWAAERDTRLRNRQCTRSTDAMDERVTNCLRQRPVT